MERVEAPLKMESSLVIGGDGRAEAVAEAEAVQAEGAEGAEGAEAAEQATSAVAEAEARPGASPEARTEASAEARAEARAEAEARAGRGGPALGGWVSHDFPTHSAGPARQQAEGLRQVMPREP